MKRILFIISKLNYSGSAKIATFVSNNLAKLGYSVYVYTYASNQCHYPLLDSVTYIPENNVYSDPIFKRLMPIVRVRRHIKRISPHIVISFITNANFISIIATAFTGIPVVIAERSDPYNEKNLSLSIMRWFYKYASGVVFQTEGAKSYYNSKIQNKGIVIPNPVIAEQIDPLPFEQRKNEMAFVGRFNIKQKRQDIMVKAFKKVVEKHKNINLVFYGDGPDIDIVKKMVKEYGLNDNVIFAGKVDNITSYLRKAKIFVLTSDYEGIPNALIEAMSLGLPIVSTDCSPGGARLLIQNNVNGVLVPKGSVDEIANAIDYLLSNPHVAENYGKEARKIVKRFSPEKIMTKWVQYIEDLITNRV